MTTKISLKQIELKKQIKCWAGVRKTFEYKTFGWNYAERHILSYKIALAVETERLNSF